MRVEKIIKKYLMMVCLSYTVVTLVFNGIAFLVGITTLNRGFNLWAFAFCFILVVIMGIFDQFHFDNFIIELTIRCIVLLAFSLGGAYFIFGIIHSTIGVIALILVPVILFGISYLLFYAKERRDAQEINDKLKRNK